MSMGGDFYEISNDQLERLLDDTLYYDDFLDAYLKDNHVNEKPTACFSQAEYFWYELTELLSHEEVRGFEIAENIPEVAGYAFSEGVKFISDSLNQLNHDILHSRFQQQAELMKKITFEDMLNLVQGLTDFYQQAANHDHAVLFRVT